MQTRFHKCDYISTVRNPNSEANLAICLLIINKIETLPELSLKSIRKYSADPIYIGYLNVEDIQELQHFSNIHFIDLREEAKRLSLTKLESRSYIDYSSQDFFSLVQLKWSLFEIVLRDKMIKTLIYSDIDVVWTDNAAEYISVVFNRNPDCIVSIQDATFKNSRRDLCMGFFALRNSTQAIDLISECATMHSELLNGNPRIGDDEVISLYYQTSTKRDEFFLLPQMSFPVGSLVNAYYDKSPFRGLSLSKPYVFHANYLIGLKRKAQLMALIGMLFKVFTYRDLIHSKSTLLYLLSRRLLVPIKRSFRKGSR